MFRNDFFEYALYLMKFFESSLEDDPSELAFSLFNEEFDSNALRVAISFISWTLFFHCLCSKKIKKNCLNIENHDNFSSPKLMKWLLTFSLVFKHKLYPLSQTWPDHGVTCSGLLLYSYSYSIQWQSISMQEGLLYNPFRCQIFVFFFQIWPFSLHSILQTILSRVPK